MINFFKKKVNKKNNNHILKLPEKFPWISTLDKNFIKLSYQDINIRIKEIQNLKKFFNSTRGLNQLSDLKNSLIASGYPENAVQLEIDFFLELFDHNTIQNLLFNPAAGLHVHQDNTNFRQKIKNPWVCN